MEKWIVKGGNDLSGTIKVDGSKNALLAILASTIITKSIIELENVTPLWDTYVMIDILKKLNVKIIYDDKNKMVVDARKVKNLQLNDEKVSKIRASYYFMGSLLSLFNKCEIIGPGGCKFASRPIDLHLFAFSKLGYNCEINEGLYTFKKAKRRENKIVFSKVSVGATINAILASCRINGNMEIYNVAKEPEVDDLISFLNKCGANIVRENNLIRVKGVNKFHGCKHKVMLDRIEAGTYLILGALISPKLEIIYDESRHLKALIDLLNKSGVKVLDYGDHLEVSKASCICDQKVLFDVYPSLATDLQQPLSILFSKGEQLSVLKDNVYPSRYTQLSDLNKMGFKMRIYNKCLYVNKSEKLHGMEVICKDLRGGISLVLASLLANGKSVIYDVYHIKRGYYDLINKLKNIGANVYEEN